MAPGDFEHPDRAETALRENRESTPTETSAISNMPKTSAASEIVLGVERVGSCDRGGLFTCLGIELSGVFPASNSAVTSVGFFTCPGATSARTYREDYWGSPRCQLPVSGCRRLAR